MNDLARQMERLRGALRVDWNVDRQEEAERGLKRRRRRRAAARAAGVSVAIVAMALGSAILGRRILSTPPAPVARAPERVLRFDDGSIAELKDAASVARTTVAPGRTVVEIGRGGARFEVARNPERVFRVEAGAVAVEVIGTRFSVDRSGEEGDVAVAVERGRVRVLAPGRTLELSAGEAGSFNQAEPKLEPEIPAPSTIKTKRSAWKSLAQGGDYDRAFKALGGAGIKTVPDDVADLLLASDVARMSRHPAEALDPLRRIVAQHRSDPRSSLAAFSLGRVLLDELGRPGEAAETFADARRLAPAGPLAEDCLAREVEAWSRAGDTARTRDRASEYLERYPAGARARTVRLFGGLD